MLLLNLWEPYVFFFSVFFFFLGGGGCVICMKIVLLCQLSLISLFNCFGNHCCLLYICELSQNCDHLADPISLVRDHQIKEKLGELDITVLSYNGDLLYEPWDVYDNNRDPFTTFAPFWDKCLNMNMEPASLPTPWRLVPASGAC